jgi:hypothetical protein
LRDDEISEALEYARQLIASEKVRQGPYNVKNEVVKASKEAWADLTPEARSLVGTLWAGKTGVDLVVTTLVARSDVPKLPYWPGLIKAGKI